MTAAIFVNNVNNFNYIEVVYYNESDYQRAQCALDNKDAESLVGKTTEEVRNDLRFRIVSSHGHFHRAQFDESGNIIELRR